jgi:hypothetical protein
MAMFISHPKIMGAATTISELDKKECHLFADFDGAEASLDLLPVCPRPSSESGDNDPLLASA